MKQINIKKHVWYQNYVYFKKKLYDDQILDFIIIIHGIHNTFNRGYRNRQSRDNSAFNYIIRSGLRSIINTPKNFRFNVSKYIITISRVSQLQKIYHNHGLNIFRHNHIFHVRSTIFMTIITKLKKFIL